MMCIDACQFDAAPLPPPLASGAEVPVSWSDICADQADGFAWLDFESDPDEGDTAPGYGHGV